MSAAEFNQITRTTAYLVTAEVGVGSLIHGLQIPFGGHLLSLNQGLFLSRMVKTAPNRLAAFRLVFQTSALTAALKSLSPVGKTLGPMMSICAQGFLFGVGTLTLGNRLAGQLLGMFLLCLWAFAQPLITYRIIYGPQFFDALRLVSTLLNTRLALDPSLWVYLFSALVLMKLLLGAAIVGYLQILPNSWWDDLENKIAGLQRSTPFPSILKGNLEKSNRKSLITGVLFDLTRPLFLASLLLMFLFFYLTEQTYIRALWLMLRPLASAVLLLGILRSPFAPRLFYRIIYSMPFGRRIELALKATLSQLNHMPRARVKTE